MQTLDTDKVITGQDGQVFITLSNGELLFLGEVETFTASLTINNTDIQPCGTRMVQTVNTGFSLSLSMTEIVVRDEVLLKPLYDDLRRGVVPRFEFQGKLNRRIDGSEQRQIFRKCVLDGTVNLLDIQPGQIIKRNWSFRVNEIPDIMDYFE